MIRLIFITLFALFFSLSADQPAVSAGNTPRHPNHPIRYVLKNLSPVSISEFDDVGHEIDHEYLVFQNEIGTHSLIYEDVRKTPQLAELTPVRDAIKLKNLACEMELDCTIQAFCAGSCKNFYYELSNLGPDPTRPHQNHCELAAFHCMPLAKGKKP